MRATKSAWLVLALVALALGASPARKSRGIVSREFATARDLFEHMYTPGEHLPGGGDGLGPLYNERSCIGCHHQGGSGGAGGNDRNVTLLTAVPRAPVDRDTVVFKGELEDLHPGFRDRPSIVLHDHAVSKTDKTRLETIRSSFVVQTRNATFFLSRSQRSTPALFGAGMIDDIRDGVLLDAEKRRFESFPEIRGRISRLPDGRLGRFGWKGQTASLRDFVLGACANELGFEVTGHHQPSLVAFQDYKPQSIPLDLTADQCALLVRFVAHLPRPIVQPSTAPDVVLRGRRVFDSIGCAACHAPTLGSIDGLYSDLLLHDLGDRVRGSGGGYGGQAASRIIDRSETPSDKAPKPTGEATPNEWRTTPLWGVADSAPYLHDGRAPTLEEAVRLHGGEAEKTTERFTRLSQFDRQSILAFLHSLRAPRSAARGDATRLAKGR